MGEIYNNQVFQSNNFQKEKKPLQSILKRKSSKNDNLKFKKKVCFENKIEFCEQKKRKKLKLIDQKIDNKKL